ncbi:McKusick-Kaufman/Bardet-Biedl syndromes putative chaperonin isoform X2 [Colossoma macropomum]|uniref:McKusick-Kaufman/Bardet-Biedl syndromes putative chaperonin isoform X2 n=1 Tax=Colossoma macropomum TaxID=42526 RepID=UPI00186558A6|nr:McKusick-Kaufman/Bardet-Biedl syndromes putative chaperonin isoform X2 [Colossoma macropomum]
MSRVCKKKPSLCTDEPLAQTEVFQKLTLLRHMLSSCCGPFGRLKQIHNNVGGHVLTTSTSAVLLKALTFSEPLLKLIATLITNHILRFGDCGLFTGIFCIGLVENAQRLNLGAAAASRVYKQLLKESIRYLTSDCCGCKVQVDFNSIQSLMALAHSVITSKTACMLTPDEAQHIISLTVQAFLQSVPCDSSDRTCFGRTVTVPLEGQPVRDSAVFSGLLVEVPMQQSEELQRLRPGPCKIVLFSTSLSGDFSEIGEAKLEIHTGVNPEGALLDQLLQLGEQAVRDGVGLFACQKVIHPVLQHYLREHGLVVIERLGAALMEPFAQMTGAIMVESLYSPVLDKAYGQVGGLCLHRRGSKELLQLLPVGEPAVTCQRAEHILRLTLKEPYALLGGGCTETLLSAYIRYMSQSKAIKAATALNCSHSQFLLGVEAFCCSLQTMALSLNHGGQHCLMDLTHAHHWVTAVDMDSQTSALLSCSCGLVKDRPGLEKTSINTKYCSFFPALTEKSDCQPRLLDSFTAKLSALNVAVEMASLVLDVKYTIKDVN